MRLYFAGWEAAKSILRAGYDRCKNVLTSYHYNKKVENYRLWKEQGKDVFIDSGAFSAWSQEKNISIDKYCQFLHKVKDYVKVYATLDAIGDADQTYRNQKAIESNGLSPLPCFHYNEPWKVLDYYCRHYEYIALGGMVPVSSPQLRAWLDDVFHHQAHMKFHGFGMTSVDLIKRYPWHSVDSSSWLCGGKFARCVLPERTISFSDSDSPDKWEKLNIHTRNHFERVIRDRYGLEIDQLKESYQFRNDVNVDSYLRMEKEATDNPPVTFINKQRELFPVKEFYL